MASSNSSGYPTHSSNDDEASLRLAMQLDAEWNQGGATSPPKSPRRDADYDASLALALQLNDEFNHPEYSEADDEISYAPPLDDGTKVYSFPPGEATLRGGAGDLASQTSASRTIGTLKDFINIVASRKCSKCNAGLIGSTADVDKLFKGWVKEGVDISSWLKCKKCSTPTCIACSAISPSKQSTVSVAGTQISWCCSRGRLFVIWILLCGFDQAYCAAKRREASKSGKSSVTRPTGSGTGYGGPRGFSFSSSMSNGVGYGGISDEHDYWMSSGPLFGRRQFGGRKAHPDAAKEKAKSEQQKVDEFNQTVLAFLVELLPSLDRQSRFDLDPPEIVANLLLDSKVLNYCAELLRNDSLDDASKRGDLYQALLNFLRIIGTHPVTATSTMFKERPARSDDINILTLSWTNNPGQSKETAMSLADGLKNLNIQSNMMLKGASRNEHEFTNDEGQDLLWLCRQISDLSEYLLTNMMGGRSEKGKGPSEEPVDHGIVEVADKEVFASYFYASNAQSLQQSPPGRIKRLITEITSLKTGLPPGIFVKYASSRLDVMKFIIVGPAGTPYENGLFEFDLFCPASYPNQSPQCYFRGACGKRFNPNLHVDGKGETLKSTLFEEKLTLAVCLSLLGTWAGEPWLPGESTILQVLISIQAMIFCEEPMYNEPGEMAGPQSSSRSKAYNENIRVLTMRYAMVDWMERPPKLWQDVVKLHFKRNANQILRTTGRWAQEQAPEDRYSRRYMYSRNTEHPSNVLPMLQQTLHKYGGSTGQQPATQSYSQQNTQRGSSGGNPGYNRSSHGSSNASGGYSGYRGSHGGNEGYGGYGPPGRY